MSFPSGSQMHRNSTPCNCMHLKGPLCYTSLLINTGSECWQSMLCPSPPFEALVHTGVVWQHMQTPPHLPLDVLWWNPPLGPGAVAVPKLPPAVKWTQQSVLGDAHLIPDQLGLSTPFQVFKICIDCSILCTVGWHFLLLPRCIFLC